LSDTKRAIILGVTHLGVLVLVKLVLLGDIGATNARFALASKDKLGEVRSFEVGQYPQFIDALAVFLKEVSSPITHSVIAVAGPVVEQRAKLTNEAWTIDADELERTFGLRARIINDFQAVALSLPLLRSEDLVGIGGGKIEEGTPKAVLGPGTGLGVACLANSPADLVIISSEGGHATLAGTCEREDRIIQYLRDKFGHASAEREISGSGLENLYQAIAAVDGLTVGTPSAAEITNHALTRDCEIAYEALHTFCAFLGSFAGNVALTFGAKGGIYIAGGISPRILKFLAGSEFRSRFESKGRFRSYLEAVPSYVIVHPAAAFLGLQSLLD
jgi:glucokinase